MDVATVLGLSRMQALWLGAFSLLLGGVIGVIALAGGKPRRAAGMHPATPNRKLVIEHSQDIPLSAEEQSLLQALFSRYQRVILESRISFRLLRSAHPTGAADPPGRSGGCGDHRKNQPKSGRAG